MNTFKRGMLIGLALMLALALCASGVAENVKVRVGYAYASSFVYQGDESVEHTSWTELYAENGIDIEVMYNVDNSLGREKLLQCIMSGDYPDVMSISGNDYLDLVNQNVFYDLTDLVDEYLSDEAKEYYAKYDGGATLNAAKVNGRIYALPVINDPNDPMSIIWLRKDWLDALNLSAPQTIDEFLEVCRAFTRDDPDGNGIDDTYAVSFNGQKVFADMGNLAGFFEMCGACPGTINSGIIPFIEDENGNAVFGGAVKDNMVYALNLLKEMYDNGYIPKDFITSGSDQIVEQASAGKIGMYFGCMYNGNGAYQNLLATDEDVEFIAIALPGYTPETRGTAYYSNPPATFYCLNKSCQNPEVLFTMFNLAVKYLASPDKLEQWEYEKYNGLAGKYTGWECASVIVGVPLKNLSALKKHQEALATGDTSKLNTENLRDYNAMQDYLSLVGRYSELNEEEIAKLNSGLFYWTVWGQPECGYAAIDEMISLGNLMHSAYNTVQTAEMVNCAATLERLTKEMIINIITGTQPIEYYDEYLATWYAMGGETVTRQANDWFAASK